MHAEQRTTDPERDGWQLMVFHVETDTGVHAVPRRLPGRGTVAPRARLLTGRHVPERSPAVTRRAIQQPEQHLVRKPWQKIEWAKA